LEKNQENIISICAIAEKSFQAEVPQYLHVLGKVKQNFTCVIQQSIQPGDT
jgi:hypothetical protein